MLNQIEKRPFGKTGHMSTRAIFGSACLRRAGQAEADQVLDMLLKYGINHIDTAPLYGDAELRLGPWMKQYRKSFFLATKIDKRTYAEAREQFHRSLERLQVDQVDLLQLHNLTDVVNREVIMGPEGALEFLVEAKDEGLTRFIGITGHGIQAAKMHMESLTRSLFDTVLLPCNCLLMRNPDYSKQFDKLVSYCKERDIAVQTIKSIARGFWGTKRRSRVTWYEPLTDDEAITKCVHWVLAQPYVFLITVGDIQELPKVLAAATSFDSPPPDDEMVKIEKHYGMEAIFS
jgi:aryl-alcohol dehydrogenase-like predicted oxidoreductase